MTAARRTAPAPMPLDEGCWRQVTAAVGRLRDRLGVLGFDRSALLPLRGNRGDVLNDLVCLGRAVRGRPNLLQPAAAPGIVAGLVAPHRSAVRALHRLFVRGEQLPAAEVAPLLGEDLLDTLLGLGMLNPTETGVQAEVLVVPYRGRLFLADAFRWRDRPDYCYLGRSSFTAADFLARRPIGTAGGRDRRLLDLGCGVGVGALTCDTGFAELLGTDVVERCLWFARVNAAVNGVEATFGHSDVFADVDGTFDLVVANTPCVWTPAGGPARTYEAGGGAFGLDLPVRMITGSLERLRPGGAVLAVIMAPYLHGEPLVRATLEDLCAGRPAHARVHRLLDEVDPADLARDRAHGVTRVVRYLVVLEPAERFAVTERTFEPARAAASRARAMLVRRSR